MMSTVLLTAFYMICFKTKVLINSSYCRDNNRVDSKQVQVHFLSVTNKFRRLKTHFFPLIKSRSTTFGVPRK